jgi:hypothetical protein
MKMVAGTGEMDGTPELLETDNYWRLYQARIDYEGDRPVYAVTFIYLFIH